MTMPSLKEVLAATWAEYQRLGLGADAWREEFGVEPPGIRPQETTTDHQHARTLLRTWLTEDAKSSSSPVGVEGVRQLLGQDTPWPVVAILRRLADAVDHLLTVHDCDAHGWEGVSVARDQARLAADRLEALSHRFAEYGAGVASRPVEPPEESER